MREIIVKVFTAIIVISILLMAVLSQTDWLDPPSVPYGLWHSSDPDITMDINPDKLIYMNLNYQ